MLSSAGNMQLDSAANMIAADLEYAKGIAVSRGQNFTVSFDVTADSYQIEDSTDNVISHPVKKGFAYIVNIRQDSRLSRVDIVEANFSPSDEVTFDYLGSPDSGGFVRLRANGVDVRVNVEAVTGYISIEDL